MAQIFGKRSNSISRITLLMAFVGFFFFWGVVYAIYRSPYTTEENIPFAQPAPFSHQHHVAGLGIDCRYCHTSVEKSSFAGVPATEICMTCHSEVWRDAPVLAAVRESFATQQPIHWTRVNQTPDFVFFNHSIHVQKGIGCSTCHGVVDRMPITWKAESLYMRWCLDCHEAPQKFIRPMDQVYNMSWTPSADQATDGPALLARYHISANRLEQLRDCNMCHR
jgi:hypothetical protein